MYTGSKSKCREHTVEILFRKGEDMNIEIDGIKTNNLKNIDVKIQKNAINLVIGPSGRRL